MLDDEIVQIRHICTILIRRNVWNLKLFSLLLEYQCMNNIYVNYFRSRSFLVGIWTAVHYILAAIATKTYFTVETFLSLPGAAAFYGCISLIGYVKITQMGISNRIEKTIVLFCSNYLLTIL